MSVVAGTDTGLGCKCWCVLCPSGDQASVLFQVFHEHRRWRQTLRCLPTRQRLGTCALPKGVTLLLLFLTCSGMGTVWGWERDCETRAQCAPEQLEAWAGTENISLHLSLLVVLFGWLPGWGWGVKENVFVAVYGGKRRCQMPWDWD